MTYEDYLEAVVEHHWWQNHDRQYAEYLAADSADQQRWDAEAWHTLERDTAFRLVASGAYACDDSCWEDGAPTAACLDGVRRLAANYLGGLASDGLMAIASEWLTVERTARICAGDTFDPDDDPDLPF